MICHFVCLSISPSIHLFTSDHLLFIFVNLSLVPIFTCTYQLYLRYIWSYVETKKCNEDKNHLCLCSNQIVKSVFNLSKLHVRSELKVSLYTLWLFFVWSNNGKITGENIRLLRVRRVYQRNFTNMILFFSFIFIFQ